MKPLPIFYYVIESNTVDDLAVNVTNTDQTISEGEDWKEWSLQRLQVKV